MSGLCRYVAALLGASSLLLAACGDEAPPESEPLAENLFQRQIEKPAWFDSVDAPRVATGDEVSVLWQSEPRCCVAERKLVASNRAFYKSCFEAIGRHFDDDELVVMCLWLMDAGAEGDQRRQIKQFLVDHYFDHDGRVDNCANCAPADTVARVARELAVLRARDGHADEASALLERVLDRRLDEISPWVQVEIYASLGRIVLDSQVSAARKERLRAALERFEALAASGDEPVARRLDDFTEVYREVAEHQR